MKANGLIWFALRKSERLAVLAFAAAENVKRWERRGVFITK